jgi:hypothetical protein
VDIFTSTLKKDTLMHNYQKTGSLVHVAPACAGSGEGSDHFGSYGICM